MIFISVASFSSARATRKLGKELLRELQGEVFLDALASLRPILEINSLSNVFEIAHNLRIHRDC